jgi:NO-binding membrane sensor protein with MHYT domain
MWYELARAMEKRRKIERQAGWVVLGGGVAVLAFWALFFTGVVDAGPEAGVLHEFEMAFPVADAAFTLMLFAAAITLFRGRPAGTFYLVAAGAMSLYLGILDLTFYGRQGLYYPFSGSGLFELVVNAACVGGGAYALRRGWRLWQETTRVGTADTSTVSEAAIERGAEPVEPTAPKRARRLEVA